MTTLVLIAEDDEAARFFYRHILSRANFDVIEAVDGAQAVALLQQHSPDILLLDMRLPLVSGDAILQYVHQALHLDDMIIVVISAHATYPPNLRPQDYFLVKPVSAQMLLNTLDQFSSMLKGDTA